MTRIHSNKRGKSHSRRPITTSTPNWVTYDKDEVVSMVVKFSQDGLNQSQIGLKLRDEYNIPLVKSIVGKTVGKILVDNNIKTEIPEDLHNMLNKAVILKEHLKNNNGDRKNVRSLELLEAKIHRLSKYYKSKQLLDKKWKYSTVVAQLS